MKILIVEDQAEIRDTLRDFLAINGHEVIAAEDGVQGLKMAAQQPEFIFCDVDMPNLNGYGMLAEIRKMPGICDVPFVFLTARADRSELREGMTSGADDYITKPFTEKDLIKAIAARTKRQQGLRERVDELARRHQHEINAQWSHELLTPLNAVMGMLDLIEMDADAIRPSDLKEMLATIRQGAERQEKLARKLIRYFSTEQMLAAAQPAQTATGAADRAVREGAARAATEAGRSADLMLNLSPGTVRIPEDTLAFAVAEVVANACAFSKAGTPVKVEGRGQGTRYRIEVLDEGPGLTAEQCARVGAFVQFDRKQREQQGLGLGLAIARSTAKLAGGCVQLAPRLGRSGLTVSFDLPLHEANRA